MTIAGYVLACCFWILAAIALVALIVFVFVEFQYYKWNVEERERKQRDETIEKLSTALADKIENIANNT